MKHIKTYEFFSFNLNDDFNLNNDKIDFTISKLIINNGSINKGFNRIYLDGVNVGSFVINTIGVFTDNHNNKKYDNSIFLSGGFLITTEYKYKGIGKEVIKKIFEETRVDNIFLYALDWQGAVGFWKRIGGEVIFRDDKKELNLIKITKK